MDARHARPMTCRAVPLRALLGIAGLPDGDDLKLTAADGLVTELPAGLVFPPAGQGATPWLAIEPPDAPWLATPEGNATGPFSLVWRDPAASGVMREQRPHAIVTIGLKPAPAARWPQLAIGDDVAADSPIRVGQRLVMTQCMVCRPVDGAGDAAVGPDLQRPHSPIEYVQPWALKACFRDPAQLVRHGDAPPPDTLGDADIDAIVAYLGHRAEHRY